MSSLRNAVKRITHKERSQPTKRKHLGILEKKKDYKERAVDYHRKEDRLKVMKEKASSRNPDEFYFGMHSSAVKDGKHVRSSFEDDRNLSPELIALMKNQDLSYVRMKKQSDQKKAERLQASLHLLDDGGKSAGKGRSRKHTIFVDSKEEAERFDVAEHFQTVSEFAGRSFNRLRKSDLQALAEEANGSDEYQDQPTTLRELEARAKVERKRSKKLAKERNKSYREMEARIQRAKSMQTAEDHLVTEKMVAGKGRKRKIKAAENGRPAQYKWRRKRLR